MGKKLLMQGNQAVAEAALIAGVKVCAGYPITPSSETIEILSRKLPSYGERFIQMEDELASIGVIIGASAAGKKAITATSGPGFSLMQELLGYPAMVELPAVGMKKLLLNTLKRILQNPLLLSLPGKLLLKERGWDMPVPLYHQEVKVGLRKRKKF